MSGCVASGPLSGHDCEGQVSAMRVFSDFELTYLARGKLGRLATIDEGGMPHVVPPSWLSRTIL